MGKSTADFYVVFVVDSWKYADVTHIRGVRADRLRSSKPKLAAGEIPVRVKLVFDNDQLIDSIPIVTAEVLGFSAHQPTPELEVIGV